MIDGDSPRTIAGAATARLCDWCGEPLRAGREHVEKQVGPRWLRFCDVSCWSEYREWVR